MYEAHIYTLRSAHSYDLSRSTSEMYLEEWEPWFLRWTPLKKRIDNVYSLTGQEVAKANGLFINNRVQIKKLKNRRKDIQKKLDDFNQTRKVTEKRIKKLQKKIKLTLQTRWPEVMNPYTLGFKFFLDNHVIEAQEFILNHPDYKELFKKQEEIESIKRKLIELERKGTQLDKILRLRKIGRLLFLFEKYASGKHKKEYYQLLGCEQQML